MLPSLKYSLVKRSLIVCVVLVVLANVFLFFFISDQSFLSSDDTSVKLKKRIREKKKVSFQRRRFNWTLAASNGLTSHLPLIDGLNLYYLHSYQTYLEGLLKKSVNPSNTTLWNITNKWVTKDQIIPNHAPLLHAVLENLRAEKIKNADITTKGTQLKILLTLESGQKALFKPKWYEVCQIIQGTVYSGKDRCHGEVISFHLARLLSLNRVPIVTWRTLNLSSDIIPVASPALNHTFFTKGSNVCFYGVCYHCKKEDPVCAKGDLLDGSVTLWLPEELVLKKYRHPWQRTYNTNPALWETSKDYCQTVRTKFLNDNTLLDLIEISVFDFLIDNGDRHHYEVIKNWNSKVLLIDNGKSFGDPSVDHLDILAPLYQCCLLRKSFLSILVSLRKAGLSKWLRKLLSSEGLGNLLEPKHSSSLDSRLDKVLAIVSLCLVDNGIHILV